MAENKTLDWLLLRRRNAQSNRVNFDNEWEKIARLVLPTSVGFTSYSAPGTRQNQHIFDSTAQLALPRFAAAIDTLITPRTSRWHTLVPKDKRLRHNPRVARYLEDVTETLFAVRYAPSANFATAVFSGYLSLGAFGNFGLFIHDARPGIRYMSVALSEVWFEENSNGIVDTFFWDHEYTVLQALEKWPGKLPEWVVKERDKNPNRKLRFCMAVFPRHQRDPRRDDNKNMRFASVTFLVGNHSAGSLGSAGGLSGSEAPVIVDESGFRTFPLAVGRYVVAPREVYGRGPAGDALADIQTLQEMAKTGLRYGQLAVDPPILTVDDDSLNPFIARPGAINAGFLNHDGTERARAMRPEGDPRFSLEMMDQKREAINQAFLINLFQVLIDRGSDRMTATEVMQLVQEKGALLGPIADRMRGELLGTVIQRELDILFNAGVLSADDVPPELVEGGGITFEYDSPLSRAMRSEEGIGALRTIEAILQVAQIDQEVLERIDLDAFVEIVSEINGAPSRLLRTPDEAAARIQAKREAAAMAQMAEAAPGLAQTAKTLVDANNAANQPRVI